MAQAQARASFWAYRQYIDPRMVRGWFQRTVARELQWFYDEMKAGLRPKLFIAAPPQHGKSLSVTDFIAWMAGQDPDLQIIYTSFSDRLGVRANLRLQRAYDHPRYQAVFPNTRINASNVVTISGQFLRNREMLEYVGRRGSFRNTTVLGSVTGEALDVGIIDDPLKGRKEANSPTVREGVWSWFTDDFFTRFAEMAGLLMIMTRWHVDDPAARMQQLMPDLRVLRFPALAEREDANDRHPDDHRKEGEPLFPELKSLGFINERRKVMTTSSFEALYQGHPTVKGGGLFPVEEFTPRDRPRLKEVVKAIRYWDKAGTQDGGAYTAGTLMLLLQDGAFVVADVQRGQWSAGIREKKIKYYAQLDAQEWPTKSSTYVEQEPGSGGKESAENTIKNLAGLRVYADRVSGQGSKETRAEPYAAQVEGGNVYVVPGPWTREWLDEHETFPNGKYKDQVDSAAGAFNKLALGQSSYTLENIS